MNKFALAAALAVVTMAAAAPTPSYAWSFDVLHGKITVPPSHGGTIKPVNQKPTPRVTSCPYRWTLSNGRCFPVLN